MYLCVVARGDVRVCLQEAEEGVRAAGVRDTGSCETPCVHAGKQTWVLWKMLLTTELPLQP